MAISRMDMERQLRAGGGIMTLDEPRQGYFLGKIVRKAKKAVKKVVKSPLGKAAILGGLGFGLGGAKFLGGKGIFAGGQGLSRFSNLLNLVRPAATNVSGKRGALAGLFYDKDGDFSLGRTALTGLTGAAVAAPFLMGGDEEVVDEGVDFSGVQPMIADIRDQAKAYYQDPTQSALYFMPPKSAVQSSFYAADGGRAGYRLGGSAFGLPGLAIKGGQKIGEMIKAGVGKVKSLFDDADINISVRDEDVLTDAGLQAQAVGNDVFITAKSKRATRVLDDLIDAGYDISKDANNNYSINALDEGALDIIAKRLKLGDKNVDEFMEGLPKYVDEMGAEEEMIYDALRQRRAEGGIMRLGYSEGESVIDLSKDPNYKGWLKLYETNPDAAEQNENHQKYLNYYQSSKNKKAEGGLMDLGGFEKDYREGGFVPLGAEERADDVPARLSKNEFVFTADAVRNAGQGDIDKGAEVMQNMMDNLEAGGTISEESQGKENPAQEMFNQAQMLESRIV